MSWNPDRYADALAFAAARHNAQKVPGSDLPYVTHVVAVAAEVMNALARERFADPNLAVACALLHDTIEDTGTTFDEVAAHFGTAIAEGVRALSKDPSLPKPAQMADSLVRIQAQPHEVWLVKLGDRATNLAAPPSYWSQEKRRAYLAEAGEILRALAPASPWLADRLATRMVAYETYCA